MANEHESLKENSNSWGGAREGAGRPKGSMNEETKLRMAEKKAFQDRVAKNAERLFNAQFNLAVGERYLFWKHKVGSGKHERIVTELIDDPETIKQYIDGTLDEDKGDDEYYYISTKPANGMAIDSLLDRSFGKAESNMKLSGDPDNPLESTVIIYRPEKLKD